MPIPTPGAATASPAEVAEGGMRLELSPAQQAARRGFREFVAERVAPCAGDWDRARRMPPEMIGELARRGWLGAHLGGELGGAGLDAITYGLLTEEIGRGCSSLRS